MTPLPKQKSTGENSQVFFRAELVNGNNFVGFPSTGHWQSVLAQAWWKFLRQEALVKLSAFFDFRSFLEDYETGLIFT